VSNLAKFWQDVIRPSNWLALRKNTGVPSVEPIPETLLAFANAGSIPAKVPNLLSGL
jgi:hypothetical protein